MFRIEEWIRKVTYLLCRTNKPSVTASSSAEEGRTRIPPTSSSSGTEVCPGLGAHRWGCGCYMQQWPGKGKDKVPWPGCAAAAQMKRVNNMLYGGKENLQWNNKNLKHAPCGKGSEHDRLMRAMIWKVKLEINEAKARRRYLGEAVKNQ